MREIHGLYLECLLNENGSADCFSLSALSAFQSFPLFLFLPLSLPVSLPPPLLLKLFRISLLYFLFSHPLQHRVLLHLLLVLLFLLFILCFLHPPFIYFFFFYIPFSLVSVCFYHSSAFFLVLFLLPSSSPSFPSSVFLSFFIHLFFIHYPFQ